MKEFLIDVDVNDGTTGEFIEKVRLIYRDEQDRFEDADELQDFFEEDDYEQLDEIVAERREYEVGKNDIYRVGVVLLEEASEA